MNQNDFYQAKLQYETDASDLFEQLKNNESVVVIDARTQEAYRVEHIPSAISFPHRTMTEESVRELNRGKTYITYCE